MTRKKNAWPAKAKYSEFHNIASAYLGERVVFFCEVLECHIVVQDHQHYRKHNVIINNPQSCTDKRPTTSV